MSVLLDISHRTHYRYGRPVWRSVNEVRATPVTDLAQRRLRSDLLITPEARLWPRHRDYFGTVVQSFEVGPPHQEVEVTARALVLCERSVGHPDITDDLEQARTASEPDAVEQRIASPHVQWDEEIVELGAHLQGTGVVDTVDHIGAWIDANLSYSKGVTKVGTTVGEVLDQRQGVCQDFVHFTCALLRSLDIPARYVSGYVAPHALEVGQTTLGQSHAWCEVFVPGIGWWGYDPTSQSEAGPWHVKVGHGRDYGDVVPMRGIHAGYATSELTVEVSLKRLPLEAINSRGSYGSIG